MSDRIYHIALPADLDNARRSGAYRTGSLDTEGFIHCCTQSQLSGVLERYFADVDDYEVVEVRIDRLGVGIAPVYENTVGGTELFPHIYTEIPLSAIVRS